MRNEIIVEVTKVKTNITLNGEKTYLKKTLEKTFPNLRFDYAVDGDEDYTIIAKANYGLEMRIENNEVAQCDGEDTRMAAQDITNKIIEVCERVRDWYLSIPQSKSQITLEVYE